MKKLGFFARIIQKAISSMVFPRGRLFSWLLPRTKYDYEKEVAGGTGSSVVMAPIFWICRRLAEAKIIIKKNDQIEIKHDVLMLLKKPNSFYSGRLLRMAIGLSFNLDGNVYLLKVRNNQLKPVELWWVPHFLMEPHYPIEGDQFIDYYEYRPQGEKIKIDPMDVIHIRFGLDPYNTRKGMSPLKSLFREIFTDDEAANFSASILRNMGIPGIVMSPGSEGVPISESDVKAIKDAYREKFGRDNRGEPLVMSSKTDVKQFGFSPAAMDLSRLREIPEERVTAILGVPAAVVGFGTGLQQTKVGATMRELRESAYEDCIIPMQNLIADELNTQLLPDFEENPDVWAIDFDLSDIRVLQEDENEKSKRVLEQMKGTLITQAEAREILGYEVRPEHEVYLMPFSTVVIPAGNLQNQTGGNAEPGQEETPPGENGKKVKYILPVVKGRVKEMSEDWKRILLATDWKRILVAALDRSEKRLRDLYAKELEKNFQKLGRVVRDAWGKMVNERNIQTLAYTGTESKDVKLDRYYADLVTDEIDTDIVNYDMHYKRTAEETKESIVGILGIPVVLTEAMETRIVQVGRQRKGLLDLPGDTRDAISRVIAEAREKGEGPDWVYEHIKDKVAAGPWSSAEIRARIIARTETKFAQMATSLEVYRAAGITRVEVVDGRLETSCEHCMDRDGDIMNIIEAMALDEHPNGTLTFTPILESLS